MADGNEISAGRTRIGAYALLCAVTCAAFWPVFTLGFVRLDDTLYVTDNPGVKLGLSLQGLRYVSTAIVSSNYHPLTLLSHQLDVTLFGLRPAGHHAVNLLFHLANVCLLFRLLTAMTRAPGRSVLAAALFAVHPLRVESVAWVSERKDVLSTFFMLLAIGAYVAFVRRRSAARYVRVVVWFALALLAKPMPVTLPFLLLLLDYWPLERTGRGLGEFARALPRLAFEKVPLFALSAASSAVTFAVQQQTGAVRGLETVPLVPRLENAAVAYAAYLGKFVAPTGLVPHYPLVAHSAARVALCVVLLAAITACAVVFARRRPCVFTGWFWYVGTLAPVIGMVQVGHYAMADRYTYFPMIGVTLALLWTADDCLAPRPALRQAGAAMVAAAIAALAVLTVHQTQYWKDSFTLFTRTLAVSPDSIIAHKVLGIAFKKDAQPAAAFPHFQRVYELDPQDRDAAFDLGTTLLALGRAAEAEPLLVEAVIAYDHPAEAYASLGRAQMDLQTLDAARGNLRRALELDPDQGDARINLGVVEGMLGNTAASVETLGEAVRRAPDNPDAHYNYGIALLNANRPNDAAHAFEEALRLRPDFPEAKSQLDQARGIPR